MTDKEVLQKAIEIAVKNGMSSKIIDEAAFYSVYLKKTRMGTAMVKDYRDVDTKKCYGVIFSHDFAKAFFPKEIAKMVWYEELKPYSFEDVESWKVHLMKMVLEENPIDYLRKFINEQSESAC